MRILFLFLDGVGLGVNDPSANPFVNAKMPTLKKLLNGQPLIEAAAPCSSERASLLALDACLGVPGLPQSATGQATLLTGRNIPAMLGYHYGPKPNPEVSEAMGQDTLFSRTVAAGQKAALLNAYPPRYFQGIESGMRIYSSIPLAVSRAGIRLCTQEDLTAGQALAADFTGQGWRRMLRIKDSPIMDEDTSGRKLSELSREYGFSLFEYWASDYAGHKQDMDRAVQLLEAFDKVLTGLVNSWVDEEGLILITSDHGNLEDLSTRRHTFAKVPAIIIGDETARQRFANGLMDITGIATRCSKILNLSS